MAEFQAQDIFGGPASAHLAQALALRVQAPHGRSQQDFKLVEVDPTRTSSYLMERGFSYSPLFMKFAGWKVRSPLESHFQQTINRPRPPCIFGNPFSENMWGDVD